MVTHRLYSARAWINRVRLPILLACQLNRQGKSIFPCPHSRLRNWSRGTGSAVPSRVSLLIYILRLNLVLLTGFLSSSAAASIYIFNKPPYDIESVPSLSGHAIVYRLHSLPRVRRHKASKPKGSPERVLTWQVTMDQLICAYHSHVHYWYVFITDSRVWINRVNNKVANPARGQLNRENAFFPVPRSRLRIWSRETGSAIPSRVSLLISILLRLHLVLTHGIPPAYLPRRSSIIHLYCQSRHVMCDHSDT